MCVNMLVTACIVKDKVGMLCYAYCPYTHVGVYGVNMCDVIVAPIIDNRLNYR